MCFIKKTKKMVYVADLGRWVNISPDSHYIDLLWKVQDCRPFAIERARLVLNPDVVRQSLESGSQTSYTYYFVSPHVAAAQFGRSIDMNSERVVDFYDRRDALMYELQIFNREFYYDPRFEVIEPDQKKSPVSLALNAENPVLMVEVVRDADGFVRPKVTREMRAAIQKQRKQKRKQLEAPSGAGEFVEDDDDVLIA
jgi:hypothetical protein